LRGDAAVVDVLERGHQVRLLVPVGVTDDEVASRGECAAQGGDDVRGLGVVGDEVQHRGQDHGDGLAEVEQ
jgi:hypothetical protein